MIEYLGKLDENNIVDRVTAVIVDMLPSGGIADEKIAESLNMGVRSLQRRLKDHQASFSGLLENTRRELSREYLRDPKHSVNEVAYLLGFSEPGNFSRAFKRWYGQTPSEFRGRHHG